MPEFFSNPIWQRFREQIQADFESASQQVHKAVPTMQVSYQFSFGLQTPVHAYASYRNQSSTREDFIVLVIGMRLHMENNTLWVSAYLERDDVEDTVAVLPELPDGLSMQIPLPALKDKSQAELEELLETPFVVSQIDEVMLAVRSFVTDKETVNAIVHEELCREEV